MLPFRFCLPVIFLAAAAASADEPRLSKDAARGELARQWELRAATLRKERAEEVEAKQITAAGKTMRWLEKTFGEKPEAGWSLWISLHGGGGAPAPVNDSQWQNQIRLYQPKNALYIAPRAPTDNWNLWHEAHIDGLFDRLIEDCVAVHGVNPDKVYVLGYSAGGDGVYQLGPRMADRWAAAAMMAGHPNDASPLPLRNLPFALFCGGKDAAYKRNEVTAQWAAKLDDLQRADPGGYEHLSRIYPESGHWMNMKDAEALPWMAGHTRQAWPKKVVWVQDDVTAARLYWLAVAPGSAVAKAAITASVEGQTVDLQSADLKAVTLRLSDELLDLDRPVRVKANGRVIHEALVPRTAAAIARSLAERADPRTAATALLEVAW